MLDGIRAVLEEVLLPAGLAVALWLLCVGVFSLV